RDWGSARGRGSSRLTERRQKRVRITLWQQLAGALAHFGTDEDELGLQLPPLDVSVRARVAVADLRLDTASRPPANGPKPMLESQCSFEGEGTQTATSYRRRASLTRSE